MQQKTDQQRYTFESLFIVKYHDAVSNRICELPLINKLEYFFYVFNNICKKKKNAEHFCFVYFMFFLVIWLFIYRQTIEMKSRACRVAF